MSTTIAIHWTEQTQQYVVVKGNGLATVGEISIDSRQEPALVGRQLSEAILPLLQGRAKVIVALSRGAVQWQHLLLPPCPDDELPDVVRLQADREMDATEEDLGFDFLALEGDEQTPYQVLTVSLAPSELTKIRQVFRAANVPVERIVPLAAGWPALTKQIAHDEQAQSQIFIGTPLLSSSAGTATLWVLRGGHVVLLRQFQMAAADLAAATKAIGNELRRTLLAVAEQAEGDRPMVWLIGNQQMHVELAETLALELNVAVDVLDVTAKHPRLSAEQIASTQPLALAALAIDEARGQAPLVDLLHPHRRPQAEVNKRTYALAVAAGALMVILIGWMGYARLQAPLKQAARDQAELTLLKQPLEKLQAFEQRAGEIRDWSAEAPNLLVHLLQVSQSLRPEALDADDFSPDQDVVIQKWDIEKRRLTIDALARNSRAVHPLEVRLRESGYRTERGKSEPSSIHKEYPWHFQSTIELTSASDYAMQRGKDERSPTKVSSGGKPAATPAAKSFAADAEKVDTADKDNSVTKAEAMTKAHTDTRPEEPPS